MYMVLYTHAHKNTPISFFSTPPRPFILLSEAQKHRFFSNSKNCHRSLQNAHENARPIRADFRSERKVPAAIGQTLSSSHGFWSQPKVGRHCAEGGDFGFGEVGFGEG